MENIVTWYKFTFAVCRKRDLKSLYYLSHVFMSYLVVKIDKLRTHYP